MPIHRSRVIRRQITDTAMAI
ncbi:hypothetical protein B4U79_05815 [Dinothrombium tinctorium]|uniref:Uncharacterized protein n=1 Tax=Dinothrombium tinctorium TaxID=1965070 RepID=A0A3S3PAL0_9ACAR|nr:hypothetical protein B4U79_05815 [Dinothrombium tinctorium]